MCLQNWQMLYELELSSQCSEQPDLVDEEVNATTGAVLNTNLANRRECNTWYCSSAADHPLVSQSVFTFREKATTRAFSWLKAPTSAFTFKTLLRQYAKRTLTQR